MESIRDFGRNGDLPRLRGLAENEHPDALILILCRAIRSRFSHRYSSRNDLQRSANPQSCRAICSFICGKKRERVDNWRIDAASETVQPKILRRSASFGRGAPPMSIANRCSTLRRRSRTSSRMSPCTSTEYQGSETAVTRHDRSDSTSPLSGTSLTACFSTGSRSLTSDNASSTSCSDTA